ncbi:MAG TPA: PEGA domain-containing protein [Candidatus Norongarragalinales archaeon]|nr:PEGA domain-containing protein [Candidatus Norongarragalinales archaeon]
MENSRILVMLAAAIIFLGSISSPSVQPSTLASIVPKSAVVVPTGVLDISSFPAGATVWYENGIRKVRAGTTPLKIGLTPGSYRISATLGGYGDYSKDVKVLEDVTENILINFPSLPLPSPSPTPTPTPRPRISLEYACEYALMHDRVKCRLDLPEAERALKVPYVPEDCRRDDNESARACLATYDLLNPCHKEADAKAKDACARGKLGLGGNMHVEKQKCDALPPGNSKVECDAGLRRKLYALVIFRIDDLGRKAEMLRVMGVNENLTIDFISRIEEGKKEFADAGGLERRKKAIWDVKRIWGDYRRDAVAQLDAIAKTKKN